MLVVFILFLWQEGDTGASTVHCSRGISSVFNKALREASHKFKELSNQRQKLHDVKSQKKRPQYKFIKVGFPSLASLPAHFTTLVFQTNKPIGNVQVYTADLSELPRCICKRTDSNPCGPDSECLNRMLMYECHPTLCPAGMQCYIMYSVLDMFSRVHIKSCISLQIPADLWCRGHTSWSLNVCHELDISPRHF